MQIYINWNFPTLQSNQHDNGKDRCIQYTENSLCSGDSKFDAWCKAFEACQAQAQFDTEVSTSFMFYG